ncbi:MAG: hypothetical protein ABL962_14205 [Fimbriimonadaceae bacterium]
MNLTFETYEWPFSEETLGRIEDILRTEKVFSFFDRNEDPYKAILFRRQHNFHDTRAIALFDQNVLNDVISLVRDPVEGIDRPCNSRGRFGAALMAFLQAANVDIEPGVAVHEKKQTALRDLQLLRCADNVDAVVYARIALGEKDRIPVSALPTLPPIEEHLDFSKNIAGRQVYRVALLKIAQLELSQLSSEAKMAEFLRWSFEEFCIARIPVLLACMYLSPQRQSPMIGSLRSCDRSRAIAGIENALWDVQLIARWSEKVTTQKTDRCLWLLCSRDKAVHAIARVICHVGATPDELSREIQRIFISHWGKRHGNEFAATLVDYETRVAEPTRFHNRDRSLKRLSWLEQDLEEALVTWRPR